MNSPATRSAFAASTTGILLIVLFSLLTATMDTIVKIMSSTMSIMMITWGRYAGHLLISMIAIWFTEHRRDLWKYSPYMQLLRSCMLAGATLTYFYALSGMPIATASAMSGISPILVTLFAPFILKEKIGIRRIAACITGFIGLLIILRPGYAPIDIYQASALCAGLFYATYLLLTRKIGQTNVPIIITVVYTAVSGFILTSIGVFYVWRPISISEFFILLGVGTLGLCAHLVVIFAYKFGSPSQLAPWMYVKFLFLVTSGYLVFYQLPDLYTWVGAGIIIASIIYITWREQVRRAPLSKPMIPR